MCGGGGATVARWALRFVNEEGETGPWEWPAEADELTSVGLSSRTLVTTTADQHRNPSRERLWPLLLDKQNCSITPIPFHTIHATRFDIDQPP